MKNWHIAAGLGGATAIGVGVWLIVRQAEAESPPETAMPPQPDPELQHGATATGYIKGEPQTINLVSVGNNQFMRDDAARNFLSMQQAASAAGIPLTATSGFRSNLQQIKLYAGWVAKLPGFNLAAKPGWSNHQGGISVDIGGVGSFTSAAYKWLTLNAGRYGFRNDVRSEYWHWTYSGGTGAVAGISR